MYLSQPRDLISSMSAGCSRRSTLLPHRDDRAVLTTIKPDAALSPNTTEPSAPHLSPSSDRHLDPSHNSSPTTPLHTYKSHLSTPFDYNKPDTLGVAMSSSESRSMSRWFRSQHFKKVWERLDAGNSETRPPHPYTELIKLCILKRREGKLTLNQLYRDLEQKFPFFAASQRGKGWKNTLRHNLSTQPYFIKLDREHGQLGKGHYWAYCPDLEKPTSLAQSSVVQLSSLWPPSVSAASVPSRQDSARIHSSPTAFQHAQPEPWPLASDSKPLPSFDECNLSDELYEMPLVHRQPAQNFSLNESRRRDTSAILMRRLSSPVHNLHPRPHRDDGPPVPMRMRSATISTISRPSAESSHTSSPHCDTRPSSSFWPARSSSPMTSSSDTDELRPALPHLPPTPPTRKSLGDYYLANPISRCPPSISDPAHLSTHMYSSF